MTALGVYLVSIPGEYQMDWPESARSNRKLHNSLKHWWFLPNSFDFNNLPRGVSENPPLSASSHPGPT